MDTRIFFIVSLLLRGHTAGKLRIKSRPAVEDVQPGWEPISVDVIGTHQANGAAQLFVAYAVGNVHTTGERKVRAPKGKGILVERQAAGRRCARCALDVDRAAIG